MSNQRNYSFLHLLQTVKLIKMLRQFYRPSCSNIKWLSFFIYFIFVIQCALACYLLNMCSKIYHRRFIIKFLSFVYIFCFYRFMIGVIIKMKNRALIRFVFYHIFNLASQLTRRRMQAAIRTELFLINFLLSFNLEIHAPITQQIETNFFNYISMQFYGKVQT